VAKTILTNKADLWQKLEKKGVRQTQQREAVLDYLSQVHNHPTAEDVFLAVKRKLPKISLATVYKNLEALVESNVASKLTYGDGSARYDIRTDHHYHTRCLNCGKVSDLEAQQSAPWLERIKPGQHFKVVDYRLEVLGYCRDCEIH
jgi:Fur family peroxide stress response transcriptional regulator